MSNVDFVLEKGADERAGNTSGDASGVEGEVLRAGPSSGISNSVKIGVAGRFARTDIGCLFLRNDSGTSGNLKIGVGGSLLESVGIVEF